MIDSEFGIFIQKDVIVLGLEKMKKGTNKRLLKQFPNEFEIESRNTYVKSSNCVCHTFQGFAHKTGKVRAMSWEAA